MAAAKVPSRRDRWDHRDVRASQTALGRRRLRVGACLSLSGPVRPVRAADGPGARRRAGGRTASWAARAVGSFLSGQFRRGRRPDQARPGAHVICSGMPLWRSIGRRCSAGSGSSQATASGSGTRPCSPAGPRKGWCPPAPGTRALRWPDPRLGQPACGAGRCSTRVPEAGMNMVSWPSIHCTR